MFSVRFEHEIRENKKIVSSANFNTETEREQKIGISVPSRKENAKKRNNRKMLISN